MCVNIYKQYTVFIFIVRLYACINVFLRACVRAKTVRLVEFTNKLQQLQLINCKLKCLTNKAELDREKDHHHNLYII